MRPWISADPLAYLDSQRLGRLATIQPGGSLQVSPVSYAYNTELEMIDIGGYNMAASRKYRNIAANGRAAFVVDDVLSMDPWRVRCLEIRGTGEAIENPLNSALGRSGPIIRIRPRRIISFGIDAPDIDPHLLVPSRRDVGAKP